MCGSVFAFGFDLFNAPRDGRVLVMRQTSPGPMGLGSTFEGRRVIPGLRDAVQHTHPRRLRMPLEVL